MVLSILKAKNSFIKIFLFLGLISLYSCKEAEKELAVVTGLITNVTTTTAEASGQIIDLGLGATYYGHCFDTLPAVDTGDLKMEKENPSGAINFLSQLTGLIPAKKYYIRSYLGNETKIVYGEEKTFITLQAFLPILSTSSVTSVTTTSAVCGGNITSDGGVQINEKGVCWCLNGKDPTVDDFRTSDGTGTGQYTSNITDLDPGHEYNIRAYATNYAGTAYGNQLLFRSVSSVPFVNTGTITNVTSESVTVYGEITSDGGEPMTEKGFCWGTSTGPTISDNKVSWDGGYGVYSYTLTGLTPNTVYYIRAYAINSVGISYGDEKVSKTYTGSVSDYDGNNYNTITIGTQVWMRENLKVTHYRNGSTIQNITDGAEWIAATSGAYCWYNNSISNKNTYGALYNFKAVSSADGICPDGWHAPSQSEWEAMIAAVGPMHLAGGMLKDTTLWISPNLGATNSSGFTALPAGSRGWEDGRFTGMGEYGFWWTSTENAPFEPVVVLLRFNYEGITLYSNIKRDGFSVRCVKN